MTQILYAHMNKRKTEIETKKKKKKGKGKSFQACCVVYIKGTLQT
jgi:hypothetical protein